MVKVIRGKFNKEYESYVDIEREFDIWYKKGIILNRVKFIFILWYVSILLYFIYRMFI